MYKKIDALRAAITAAPAYTDRIGPSLIPVDRDVLRALLTAYEAQTRPAYGGTQDERYRALAGRIQQAERLRQAAVDAFNYLFGLHQDTPQSRPVMDALLGAIMNTSPRHPRIVCLCGSTRFYQQFQEANFTETMAGRIVLSVGFYPHSTHVHGEGVGITPEQKHALDDLHKRKIDLADEVYVLNVNGYIGDSTRSEIAYAEAQGKPIRWLEPPPARDSASGSGAAEGGEQG